MTLQERLDDTFQKYKQSATFVGDPQVDLQECFKEFCNWMNGVTKGQVKLQLKSFGGRYYEMWVSNDTNENVRHYMMASEMADVSRLGYEQQIEMVSEADRAVARSMQMERPQESKIYCLAFFQVTQVPYSIYVKNVAYSGAVWYTPPHRQMDQDQYLLRCKDDVEWYFLNKARHPGVIGYSV